MKCALLIFGLLLAACSGEGLDRPLVDIEKLGEPRRAPPAPVELDPADPLRSSYAGPHSPEQRPAWREAMARARIADRRLLAEVGGSFAHTLPELAWTKNAFVETILSVQDRFFFDPTRRKYTVERYLQDLKARFGGVDLVIISAGSPNLGVDERNQFDLLRDLPGGLPALRGVVEDFHRRGVKILLSFYSWDRGTRFQGKSAQEAILEILRETGADGVFGDTMIAPPRSFFEQGRKSGLFMALEPEAGLGDALEALLWTPMSWAWWKNSVGAPGVDRYRWTDRGFMRHVGAREGASRIDGFQYAWLNGDGILIWENFYGLWNALASREAEIVRRMAMIYRALPSFVHSEGWEPHVSVLQKGVFASRWSSPDSGTIWTFVNRTDQELQGPQLRVEMHGQRFYNLWTGEELRPQGIFGELNIALAELKFSIEAHGFSAILETSAAPGFGSNLQGLLEKIRERNKSPIQLATGKSSWIQKFLDEQPSKRFIEAPSGMVRFSADRLFRFRVTGIDHETIPGTGVQYPWEPEPGNKHDGFIRIPAFFLDRHLVTNAKYKKYLDEFEYRPFDRHNFLRHWPKGKLTTELENKPATWISIEEARAYCNAYGKRLPREWEWQYAAQGVDDRKYPWGNDWDPSRVPVVDSGRLRRLGPDVGSFPRGVSASGIYDLVGLVWQWTDEVYDGHSRFALLKGGSFYQPQGSPWYFSKTSGNPDSSGDAGGYRVDQHARYLLMAPSLDRSGTIGFRCAADAG